MFRSTVNYNKCILCQKNVKDVALINPKNACNHTSGYTCFEEILIGFDKLDKLPLHLEFLLEVENISKTLSDNSAKWHKSCRLKFSRQVLYRNSVRNDLFKEINQPDNGQVISPPPITINDNCFLCKTSSENLRTVTSLECDTKIRFTLKALKSTLLSSIPNSSTLHLKYHLKCLVSLNNKLRSKNRMSTTRLTRPSNESFIDKLKKRSAKLDGAEKNVFVQVAKNIRQHLINNLKNSSLGTTQTTAVPERLITLIKLILLPITPLNKEDKEENMQSILTIAQVIKYNFLKYRQNKLSETRYHHTNKESPLLHYIGDLLYHKTRSSELIGKIHSLGLCSSYKRVMKKSTDVCNHLCDAYNANNVVCPPNLAANRFVTGAFDNIDYDPSSNTAKWSFHGTAISINTHSVEGDERFKIPDWLEVPRSNDGLKKLPYEYTTVEPISLINTTCPILNEAIYQTDFNEFNNAIDMEHSWLEEVNKDYKECIDENSNISWSACK